MFPPLVRRLVAALLAFWLPLQLGTAFAVAAPMQVAGAAGIETVGHAGHHRSASVKAAAEARTSHDHASHDHASHGQLSHGQLSHGQTSHGQTSHGQTSHGQTSHGDCHEATAATPGSGPGCASSMGFDGASCVKCAFCFASAVALAVAVPKAFDLVARSAPILVVVAALDSRELIPPDPPPIA